MASFFLYYMHVLAKAYKKNNINTAERRYFLKRMLDIANYT